MKLGYPSETTFRFPYYYNFATPVEFQLYYAMSEIEKYKKVRRLEVAQTGTQFSREISDSLILKYNWGNLLSAAPLALGFVGACQVVASSPTAAGVKLQRPAGGFKYLL